jgi:multidrug efflux system outer membrane protein
MKAQRLHSKYIWRNSNKTNTIISKKPAGKTFFILYQKYVRLILLFLPLLILFSFSSCYKETAYKRPPVQVPSSYKGMPTQTCEGQKQDYSLFIPSTGVSLGDLFWWDLLQDDVLKDLIKTAVEKNTDVRIASERILEAQARYGIARSAQSPYISANANASYGKTSKVTGVAPLPAGTSSETSSVGASLQAIFELDFWGRLRKISEAARYDLLATEEAKNTVLMTLVSEVASAYFELRELDLELEIAKKTLAVRQESYDLIKTREEHGYANLIDVYQAEKLVLDAKQSITRSEKLISFQENYISTLIAKNPQDIPRGKPIAMQIKEPVVPPGLPSAILENRPDIRVAEKLLIEYGIKVDVAKTAYFPIINLTGSGGLLSRDLINLFDTRGFAWNLGAQFAVPIFDGGEIRNKIKVAESQQRQATLIYEQVVRNAFREVSDSLVDYSKSHEYRIQQESLVDNLQKQSDLADARYKGGKSSYLEVLVTEIQFFQAKLDLAKSQQAELLSIIKLYKALGGGWKV